MALSILVGLVGLLQAHATAAEKFTPRGGKYTVRFPGKPKELSQWTKSVVGNLKVHTATYANADGSVCMVSYTEFPAEAIKPEYHDTLFAGIKEGLVGQDGKVVWEKDIEVRGREYAGKEVLIDKGQQHIRYRVVVKNTRLFQVAALGSREFVTEKPTTDFLDSFEPTE
jgi:hypothetical protein